MEKISNNDLTENLDSYSSLLKERIDTFIKKVNSSSDKFSELMSDEGLWLLNNPFSFIKKEEKEKMIRTTFDIVKKDVENIENTNFKILSYNYFDMSMSFFDDDKPLMTWYVTDKKLNIPLYNLLEKAQIKIDDLTDQIHSKEDEIKKTTILLKNPDSLMQNGYYVAFLKSVLPFSNFKKDSKLLMNTLNHELNELIEKRKALSEKFLLLKKNENLEYILDYLSRHYIVFPYNISYSNYNDFKITVQS